MHQVHISENLLNHVVFADLPRMTQDMGLGSRIWDLRFRFLEP